jgi:2-hydroxychromene-2-carboxylate isomerase
MTPAAPRFYFSFRSPYSWIGARKIEERYPRERLSLDYVPYWEPEKDTLAELEKGGAEFLYRPMSRARQMYILQDVKRIWTQLGYRAVWPVDGEEPCWELPHLAYLQARRSGRGQDFFWAVWRARWEEGRNVTLPATIASIGSALGLDPAALCDAHRDPSNRQQGIEALRRAWRDGVFGVPFFVLGHERFWGQDRVDEFLQAVHRRLDGAAACPA